MAIGVNTGFTPTTITGATQPQANSADAQRDGRFQSLAETDTTAAGEQTSQVQTSSEDTGNETQNFAQADTTQETQSAGSGEGRGSVLDITV